MEKSQRKCPEGVEAEASLLQTQFCEKATRTARLSEELERLKTVSGVGHELEVVWVPGGSSRLSGEVCGNVIRVYDEDFDTALCTLRHEFLDFLVSRAIEPYVEVTALYKVMINGVLKRLGDDAYVKKERVVEALSRVLNVDGRSETG